MDLIKVNQSPKSIKKLNVRFPEYLDRPPERHGFQEYLKTDPQTCKGTEENGPLL